MRRDLSSKWTFFHKFVSPAFFVVAVCLYFYNLFSGVLTFPKQIVFFSILFIAAIAAQILWISINIKYVSMDNDFLYVGAANDHEIKIPLGEIATVKQNNWVKPYPITIRFREGSSYDGKLMLGSSIRFFRFISDPIVDELTQIARQKRFGLR